MVFHENIPEEKIVILSVAKNLPYSKGDTSPGLRRVQDDRVKAKARLHEAGGLG
jgi:hypothetical protein